MSIKYQLPKISRRSILIDKMAVHCDQCDDKWLYLWPAERSVRVFPTQVCFCAHRITKMHLLIWLAIIACAHSKFLITVAKSSTLPKCVNRCNCSSTSGAPVKLPRLPLGLMLQGNSQFQNSRVVGGVLTTPNEFPFVVSMQRRSFSWSHWWGGSIYNENWIITNAHCYEGYYVI